MNFKSNVNKEMGVYTNLRKDTGLLIKTINREKENPTWVEDDITSFPTINDIDIFSYKSVVELNDLIFRNESLKVKKLVKTNYNSSRRLKEYDH